MATMSALRSRAAELALLPRMTPVRIYTMLGREFPDAERFQLVNAAKLEGHHRGITPGWTEWGQPLRPTQIRFQTRKRGAPSLDVGKRVARRPLPPSPPPWTEMDDLLVAMGNGALFAEEGDEVEFPTMTIPARQIAEDDFVEGAGVVVLVHAEREYVSVFFRSLDTALFKPDEKVQVRIEDDGMDL